MNADKNEQLIDQWLYSKRVRSSLTRDGYAADFLRFREFVGLDTPLDQVTMDDVKNYAKHLTKVKTERKKKLRANRQARLLNAVKSFYTFATKYQLLDKNPALAVAVPKAEDPLAERLMSRDEVDRLIAAVDRPRDALLLRVMFYSGARVTEAIGLQWRHVRANKEGGQLTLFGKCDETRFVIIPGGLYEDLLAYKATTSGKAHDYVFPSQKSPQISRDQVLKLVKKAAKKAGLSWAISPHWLRHANATIALENGASLPLVQKTLGHSSLSVTQKYLHVRPDDSTGLYLDKKKV